MKNIVKIFFLSWSCCFFFKINFEFTLTSKIAANGAASISSAENVVPNALPRDNNSPRTVTACEIYSGFFISVD